MRKENNPSNRPVCELLQEAIGLLSGVQLGLLRGDDISEAHLRLPLQWVSRALSEVNEAARGKILENSPERVAITKK